MINKGKNIVCYASQVETFYFSPVLLLDNNLHSGDFLNMYAFIAYDPNIGTNLEFETPENTSTYRKQILKNLIYLKKINLSDISVVTERIDWKANTFYDAYSHLSAMSMLDVDGKLIKKFYVRNKYDQVFKCLWNNINVSNTYSISNVISHTSYYTIEHSGGTFDIGEYVTIDTTLPEEYNGTYKVINSEFGVANVAYGESGSYIITTTKPYVSGGTIKSAILSTEEPYFSVGTFDENDVVLSSDGYKWKYLCTLDKAKKLKFFDLEWMPISINANQTNPYLTTANFGSIDTINVVDGGIGYTQGTNTVNIVITGDGSGAQAEAYVENGSIKEITMIDPGKNYTSANVTVSPAYGYSGSGARVQFNISPIGGHGYDLLRELNCRNVMISSSLEYSENGKLPTDLVYNQVGILYNPFLYSDLENHANSSYIVCMTELIVSSGDYNFVSGETVYQGIDANNTTFTATVVSFDSSNNSLKVINTYGDPQQSYEITGTTSFTSRVITSINSPSFIPSTGSVFYLENRAGGIQRDPMGTDQLRILISYS